MESDTLICCYSRTGTARSVSEQLAALTGWATAEIHDLKPRVGALGDLRCVISALIGSAPYRYDGPPLQNVRHLVAVAPIWVGSLATPMRSFLRARAFGSAGLSLICVASADDGLRAVGQAAEDAARPVASSLVLRQQEVDSGLSPDQLTDFARLIEHRDDYDQTRVRPNWISPQVA